MSDDYLTTDDQLKQVPKYLIGIKIGLQMEWYVNLCRWVLNNLKIIS